MCGLLDELPDIAHMLGHQREFGGGVWGCHTHTFSYERMDPHNGAAGTQLLPSSEVGRSTSALRRRRPCIPPRATPISDFPIPLSHSVRSGSRTGAETKPGSRLMTLRNKHITDQVECGVTEPDPTSAILACASTSRSRLVRGQPHRDCHAIDRSPRTKSSQPTMPDSA